MRSSYRPPIFCDNCSSFAMAELEGVVLCTGCLMRALLSSEDADLFDRITPLDTRAPKSPTSSEAPPP